MCYIMINITALCRDNINQFTEGKNYNLSNKHYLITLPHIHKLRFYNENLLVFSNNTHIRFDNANDANK
jgi:hypothetical protein